MHTPQFANGDSDSVNVTIRETDGAGHVLLTVEATDEDSGNNGLVRYSLDQTDTQLDLFNYVIVDSTGGELVQTNSSSWWWPPTRDSESFQSQFGTDGEHHGS